MKQEFRPWFEKKTREFGSYIEKDIGTLLLILENDTEVGFDEKDLENLRADLFENGKDVGDAEGLVFTFLIENGVDDPEEFLKKAGALE